MIPRDLLRDVPGRRFGSGLKRFLAVGTLVLAGLSMDSGLVRAQDLGGPATGRSVAETSQSFSSTDKWPGAASVTDVVISVVVLAAVIVLANRRLRSRKLQWLVVALSVILTARYLIWRGLYTLNTSDSVSLGLSLTVLAAELYGLGGVLLFYFQIVKPIQRPPKTADRERLPRVDVLVTICNEPLDILRRTLVACQAMEYPSERRRVYVLDDGGRAEVRVLAAQLGCVYLSRPTREYGKAGNLNYALPYSSGDLILMFDTDHVPVRTFLMETVGHFEDPLVAIVQTPHHFYNPDIFQRNFRLEEHLINEQDLFFQVVQPGRDGHNSAFFCGSGGIFRRRALEEVGGFVTASVTEDIHTTLRLHAKGYRSIYVNKRLAAGLAPESCASYLRQRQRWTRGHIQMFLSGDNPLFLPGLSLAQRIDYLASIYYFLLGPARVAYLMAPLAYLLFGKYVVVADALSLLTFYVAHYVGAVLATGVVTRGFRNPFWADLYETVMSVPLAITTFTTVLFRKSWAFLVTPKGIQSSKYRLDVLPSAPYVVIAGLLLVGIALGVAELIQEGRSNPALTVSLVWGAYNAVLCATAAMVARERPQRRTAARLAADLPCELGVDGAVLQARTFDVSESGVRLFLDPPRFLPRQVDVRLVGDGETTELRGTVVRNDRVADRSSFVGIEFGELSEAKRASIIRHMYCAPSAWERVRLIDTGLWRSFVWLSTAVFRSFGKERSVRRLAPRFDLAVPCELVSRDDVISGQTEDMSETGLLIRFPNAVGPVAERCVVRLIPGMDVYTIKGRVVWQQSRTSGLYVGLRCEEPLSRFLITWIEFAQQTASHQRAAPTTAG
jgi:cellulose synthase (UDP-forming)